MPYVQVRLHNFMIRKNQILRTEIMDVNNLGYGVCRIEDKVTFVANAVDGDVCDVKIIKTAQNYNVARIENIITYSSHRTESICPVSEKCGGCIYRHITYEHEKQLKQNYIRGVFLKNGLSDIKVAELISADITDGYRNKVQYPVGEDGKIGYYAAHSHDIVEVGICALQSRAFDRIISFLSDYIKRNGIKNLRHIYMRYAEVTGEVMVCFVAREEFHEAEKIMTDELAKHFPEIKSVILNINPDDTNVILGDKCIVLNGRSYIRDILCGLKYHISAKAFYQVNHSAAELLYRKVCELAQNSGAAKICDLFCGIGTIGLTVAKELKTERLTGVEIIPEAVEDSRENARINNIDAEFICSDAACDAIKDSDTVIIDPPRGGCSRKLIGEIASASPRSVIYISCSPDTLARDISLLRNAGYTCKEAFPIDMFPRTGHVETVVLLSHKNS